MSDNTKSANSRSFTSGDFLFSKNFWVVATGAIISTIVAYNVFKRMKNQ